MTGARLSEALGVTPSSFYLEHDKAGEREPHVILITLKQRKKKTRYVPLEDAFALRFKRYLGSRTVKLHNERIFPRLKRYWQRSIVAERKKHNFDVKFTAPTFRHSCAVHLNLMGFDSGDIKDWLGHSDIKSTHIYAEVPLALKRKVTPSAVFR